MKNRIFCIIHGFSLFMHSRCFISRDNWRVNWFENLDPDKSLSIINEKIKWLYDLAVKAIQIFHLKIESQQNWCK
jgi:hypothetical protein